MELRAVEGKLSKFYNTFDEYEFEECLATDTRLMGVVALRLTWTGKQNSRAKFYQVIHLDFSEYGVDDYFEYECVPGQNEYHQRKDEMKYRWNNFLNVMGGEVITISPEVLVGLMKSAMPLADNNRMREYDDEENRAFRADALIRMNLMIESLEADGKLTAQYDEMDVIRMTSKKDLAACETINYFLMRLVDQDYLAAASLGTMNPESLHECPLVNQGIQTLIKNKIKMSQDPEDKPADNFSHPYRCNMVTLGNAGYYYCTLVIYLTGDYKTKDSKVSEIKIGSINRMSEYEAAVQLQVSEYITVFDCRDRILNNFDGGRIQFLIDVEPQLVNNGWLYTIYNKDNSHVNKADYWLNDDVYGYALLTIDGEFILMSNKINNITYMDDATSLSMYSPYMDLDGRYQLNTPIFHTLCQQNGVMFRDLIDNGESPR